MSVTILTGDCRDVLKTLADNSVQCCVTSPPYYGLRDYGVDGQIGLEQTPDDYVAEMVDVFREVRRVLRADGTCWLNLGDSYARNGGTDKTAPFTAVGNTARTLKHRANHDQNVPLGYKQKDLLMIPAQVALALRADGWYLRSDIIWHKPNPMPESCKDRPTSAHEHVFLLTKHEKYFYDHAAIAEPFADDRQGASGAKALGYSVGSGRADTLGTADKKGLGVSPSRPMRNARNVWTISKKPFKGAHFATMPIDLAEKCVSAGTSEHGACASCAAPYERIVEKGEPDLEHQIACGASADGSYDGQDTKDYASANAQSASDTKRRILEGMVKKTTVGWKPTCGCNDPAVVPCVVLDPFGGSGTTGLAATNLKCDAVLIELNPAYVGLAKDRVGVVETTLEQILAQFA